MLLLLFYSFIRRQGETESESWPAGAPGAPRGDHGAPRGSREAWGAQEGGPTLWETLWGIPGAPRETLWGTLWGYYTIGFLTTLLMFPIMFSIMFRLAGHGIPHGIPRRWSHNAAPLRGGPAPPSVGTPGVRKWSKILKTCIQYPTRTA